MGVVGLEYRALHGRQVVQGRDHEGERGDEDHPAEGHPEGDHDGDLGHEARHQREPEARHPAQHHVARQPRAVVGDPPHRAYLEGVVVVLEGPSDGEQQRADYAVGEHHEQRAGDAQGLHRGYAQENQAHVGDRGVGDHPLQVGLAHAHPGPVGEARHPHEDQERDEHHGGCREGRDGDPEEAVGPHLQHDAGQYHRAGRGRLHVGVGEPRVNGHAGHLGRESHQEQEPDEVPEPLAHLGPAVEHRRHVEGALREGRSGVEVHHEDAYEHQDARGECVDEELHRCVAPVLASPHEDQEEHGYQGQLPEDVEHEEVEGDEDADHGALHDQEKGVEVVALLGVPLDQHGERDHERGQPHHRQREGVRAHVPGHPDLGDQLEGRVLELVLPERDGHPVHVAEGRGRRPRRYGQQGQRDSHADVPGYLPHLRGAGLGKEVRQCHQDEADQYGGQREDR